MIKVLIHDTFSCAESLLQYMYSYFEWRYNNTEIARTLLVSLVLAISIRIIMLNVIYSLHSPYLTKRLFLNLHRVIVLYQVRRGFKFTDTYIASSDFNHLNFLSSFSHLDFYVFLAFYHNAIIF